MSKKIVVMNGEEQLAFDKADIPSTESSATCACRDCTINEPPETTEPEVNPE